MNLYEMTQAAMQLYAMLADEEIDEQTVTDTLDAMGVGDKLEDYCKVIRQFEADAAAFKAEKDRFAAKQKRAENAVLRLKSAMLTYMQTAGEDERQCGVFDVKVSHSRSVNVTNESLIPATYRKPQPDAIDKAGLRKALFAGEVIEGAELVTNDSINIK